MRASGSLFKVIVASLMMIAVGWQTRAQADDARSTTKKDPHQSCLVVDRFFEEYVWAKVGERTCLKCHHAAGDGSDSEFLLQETLQNKSALRLNCESFRKMALDQEDGRSRLLVKVSGGLDHGGGEVLKRDSTSYKILEHYVRRLTGKATPKPSDESNYDEPRFFEGVTMTTPQRLLRRVTLSLAGRLPTEMETAIARAEGLAGIGRLLDQVLQEDAFYARLKEGFNDIFLTVGYDGTGESVLSYNHFQPTRLWYQKFDLSHIPEKDRRKAGYKLAADYREALRCEPMELIEHIVRNDHPFTELVTADYIMVSPYSSRGYGVFEQLKDQFKSVDDPFEYVPVKLKALKSRTGKVQDSESGFYPHAGVLSMFHYLRRYPTTETNRNRLRARMYYQHFLGVDVMALAPRVTDAAAVTEQFEIPTMQAADCVVCHKSVDPVAGLFQAFNMDGHLGPRKEGWYTDMFGPGFEGAQLPEEENWRSLQWLGQRTASDPRFAIAMVEHVYYILFGRKVLQAPEDIDDEMFAEKRRAYREQRQLIQEIAVKFAKANFNLKLIFKALVASDFYRVDGLQTALEHPHRQAELDDVGIVRLLTPEQLERKIEAIFGQRWGRLDNRESRFKILYGGIDSKSVTERMTDPSGAMGAIQRIMANDVSCKNVALDFTKPASERRLFPNLEPDVLPGTPATDEKIRKAIVNLHRILLGNERSIDDAEIERTYQLFASILKDAQATKGIDKRGSYFCERVNDKRLDDSNYTLRAWRAVVTYLLRQHDFLYE